MSEFDRTVAAIFNKLKIIPLDQYPDTILLLKEDIFKLDGANTLNTQSGLLKIMTSEQYYADRKAEKKYESRLVTLEERVKELEGFIERGKL